MNNDLSPETRVLIVEDDDEIRVSIADYLRSRGLQVVEAESGVAYYRATRAAQYDVVVLDIGLPDTIGFDLARELAHNRATGVIMLSARSGRDDRVEAYTVGADLYLTKPVDGEELFLAIQNLAKRLIEGALSNKAHEAAQESSHRLPEWKLDMPRHSLICPNGAILSLTGREAMLLHRLAQVPPGTPVPRSTFGTLLGYDSLGPESRSLDSLVRRLRQKALLEGCDLPIHSIYAIGLSFSAPLHLA